jgi:hypothetical protein
MPAIEYQ